MNNSFQHSSAGSQAPLRVVVLGSQGFVGKSILAGLASQGVQSFGVNSTDINLIEPHAVDKLNGILHPGDQLIFVSAITPDKGKDLKTFTDNLKMGEHVALALETVAVNQIIYISSDAVFPEDLPTIDETTLPSPQSFHGLMHLAREKILEYVTGKRGIPYLILRPCTLYGRGDTHGSYGPNRFVRTANEKREIKLFGKGEEKRPHLYIADFVNVVLESLLRRTTGLLNVAPCPSYSFMEVAQTVSHLMKDNVRIECQMRSGIPTHKHFSDVQLRTAFPNLRMTSLVHGLGEVLSEASQFQT